jgi:ABC-type multidrug transport system fused ATPase/permease subunit
VGRTQAIFNAAQLALVVFALHEVLPVFYNALSSGDVDLRGAILSTILAATDGWALHAFCAVFLISASNSAWIKPALRALSSESAAEPEAEAAYTQLYLRLISSIPLKKSFSSGIVRRAAQMEAFNAASTARLHFFTTLAVAYVLLSTVAVMKPAGAATMSMLLHLIKLDALKERPIVWKSVFDGAKSVGLDLLESLRSLFHTELEEVRHQPLRVAVVISLLTALLVVSYMPSLERNRKGISGVLADDEDEEQDTITSLWSNIGSSSATRLSLLSSPRGVEGALDQFSKLRPDRAAAAGMLQSKSNAKLMRKKRKGQSSTLMLTLMKPVLRELAYLVFSLCVLSAPLALYTYVWAKSQSNEGESSLSLKSIPLEGWKSLLDMAALLFVTNLQYGRAVHCAISAANAMMGSPLTSFFRTLSSVVGEVQNLAASASSNSDFQAMLTASPVEGLAVRDFWTAHSTRKAWAIKGANLQCRNGEVVVVIGTGGAGKSRLLTSVSEHIFSPPKSARTTTIARGTISIAGIDLSKWDRAQLQRRVGVWLHDVRTVSDYASLVTGCTLEEILEPVSDSQMNTKERSAVALAMKITGLSNKLSKQLPSRLSTVVSANEDELRPSPLRPPSYPLSPSEWTLVLLTKVLAQLIAGNDSQQTSSNSIAKCLIGSILLLDDATSQMSEVDEAHFITAVRSTGAAVILTSNRWATGRFADRIVVIDNGAVVESGTHTDLINLGPERSLYAHHWNAMSSI